MDTGKWAICCVLCLVAAGCRTDPHITALERECRRLEDQLYAMEDELSRAESALERCQGGVPAKSRGVEDSTRSSAGNGSSDLPSIRGPKLSPQNGGPRSPVDTRTLELPDVEVPGAALPSGEFPKTLSAPSGDRSGKPSLPSVTPPDAKRPTGPESLPPPFPRRPATSGYDGRYPQRPSYDGSGYPRRDPYYQRSASAAQGRAAPPRLIDPRVVPAQAIALDPRADNRRVERVTLNRALTGGYERDAQFGDAGVAVLVEPRDARGQLVAAAGPISVVLLDRGASGDAARVARWEFTAEQAATLYRRTPHGEGFYLEMPWPGSPPARSHLHLFVRYTTKDRRNVEASREIDVALRAEKGRNWLALNPEGNSQPSQIAGTWQQKTRRDDDPPVRVASVERSAPSAAPEKPRPAPEIQPAVYESASPPEEKTPPAAAKATPAESKPTAESKPEAASSPAADQPQRPVWSPNRN